MPSMEFKVGDRVKFASEKQAYTVRACDERFAICTKPFNARKTYLYSIIDQQRGVRGPDNMVLGAIDPYDTTEGAAINLALLVSGEMEVSHRRHLALDVEAVNGKRVEELQAA